MCVCVFVAVVDYQTYSLFLIIIRTLVVVVASR